MRRSPKPTAASARSTGWRSTPARNRPASMAPTSGCPTKRWRSLRDYVVSIKGPLTTPVGGGIRSLNVALRQQLDLYVCLRPVRYFTGVPSPVKEPEKTDMVIFRENSEDIYAGIEWAGGSADAKKLIDFLINEMGVQEDPLPGHVRHRHQAGVARRHRAAGAQGDPVRDRQRPQVGDARAQGQHHEVHRRRRSATGATRSRSASSARSRSTADRGASSRTRRPAATSSSRT